MNALRKLDITYSIIASRGETYYVTSGTGEAGFGSNLGGSAAFAYLRSEVDALEVERVLDYSDFCQLVDPFTSIELALACAEEGLRLAYGGSCNPVLTDAEYLAARDELVGERVEAGKTGTEDEDAGKVLSVVRTFDTLAGTALVAWDGGNVRTTIDVSDLRLA